jgi:hypothetical protein
MVQDILERLLPIVGAGFDNKQPPIPLGGSKDLFLHINSSVPTFSLQTIGNHCFARLSRIVNPVSISMGW